VLLIPQHVQLYRPFSKFPRTLLHQIFFVAATIRTILLDTDISDIHIHVHCQLPFYKQRSIMSGQRSADDAGDNLGNDGFNHRNVNDVNFNGEQDGNSNNNNNNLRRRNDSTASGMAGGCSMREGADSVELRSDGSISNSTVLGSHNLSRPQHIHHNIGNVAATTANDGPFAVFSWGRGEDGQLGLGDTADQDEPTYVRTFVYYLVYLASSVF
jgi:hypothetical protein